MSTMNISLHLIRKDKERLQVRALLLAGAASHLSARADKEYFLALRKRVGQRPVEHPGREERTGEP